MEQVMARASMAYADESPPGSSRSVGDGGIEVVATTISGSVSDWGKIERIGPLFRSLGRDDAAVHSVDSHAAARALTSELLRKGSRIIISAGGSGTFNSVLEGCIDSGVGLGEVTLGFLRKGSADLIGKALGMPDDIEEAVRVFAKSLAAGSTVPCDIIAAVGGRPGAVPAPLRRLRRHGDLRPHPPLHREPLYQILQGCPEPALRRPGAILLRRHPRLPGKIPAGPRGAGPDVGHSR